MKYTTDLIPSNTKRRPAIKMKSVKFMVAHDIGVSDSTARNNVDYFKRTADDSYASAHIFVDDIEAIMCIPAFENVEIAYHVRRDVTTDNEEFGTDAIDSAIGVELAYFEDDYDRSLQAYKNYVDIFVDLFIFHNVNINELESHENLDPTRRADPNNALKHIGKTFENLKADILQEYNNRNKKTADEIVMECFDNDGWILQMDRLEEFGRTFKSEYLCKSIRAAFEKVYEYGKANK